MIVSNAVQVHTEHCLGAGDCTALSHKAGTMSTFKRGTDGSFVRIAQFTGITESQVNSTEGNSGANLFNKMTACSPLYNSVGAIVDCDTRQGKRGPQCVPIYTDGGTFFYSLFMCPRNITELKSFQKESLDCEGIADEVSGAVNGHWKMSLPYIDKDFSGTLMYGMNHNHLRVVH